MSLSPGLEYEKALRIDNRLKEIEIFDYLNGLDRTDKLLLRDTYYLFCGGNERKQERYAKAIFSTFGTSAKNNR